MKVAMLHRNYKTTNYKVSGFSEIDVKREIKPYKLSHGGVSYQRISLETR
ncbi:MAG: hypothetical protein GX820_03110 [Bacteroidales bacterium]|jgi:hypothetical protein|nr:hypothetical protein [Bacteroidales bacterium]